MTCVTRLTAGTGAGPQPPPPSNHISEGLDAATAKASPKTRQEVAKPFRHVSQVSIKRPSSNKDKLTRC